MEFRPEELIFQHHIVEGIFAAVFRLTVDLVFRGFRFFHNDGGVAHGGNLGLHQDTDVAVVPVPLQAVVHQLVPQYIALGVGEADAAHVTHPIPYGDLGDGPMRLGSGIEDVEDTGLAAAPFRIGHTVIEADVEAQAVGPLDAQVGTHVVGAAGTLGLGQGDVGIQLDGRGVDISGDHFHTLTELGMGIGEGLGELAHGIFPGILDAGAGENVVEMGIQHILPGLLMLILTEFGTGEGQPLLCIPQDRLGFAVGPLDPGLGGVAACENKIQLPVDEGQLLPDGFRFVVEFCHGAEFDGGPDGPGHHIDSIFDVPAGGTAAVVAYTVDDQTGFEAAAGFGNVDQAQTDLGHDAGIVPVLFPVDQNLFAGGGLPAVQGGFAVQGPAMIHVLHTAEAVDFRNEGAVAEGVGGEVNFQTVRVNAPGFRQIILGILNVAEQRFGAGHIFVTLHPGGGGDLPAAFTDSLPDFRHHIGIVFLHHFIDGGLGLGEAELRVLVHQIQNRAESGQGQRHRLMVGPHPVHVNVGMARQDQLVLLGGIPAGKQEDFHLFADSAGQNSVGLHGVIQNIHGRADAAVKAAAMLLIQPDGKFQLAEKALDMLVGNGDVQLLLQGQTEAFFVVKLLPVAAHGSFQLNKLGPEIHGALSFVYCNIGVLLEKV